VEWPLGDCRTSDSDLAGYFLDHPALVAGDYVTVPVPAESDRNLGDVVFYG